jgi:hypothetical protein
VWPDGAQFSDNCNLIVDWALGLNRQVSLALSKPIGFWKFRGQPQLDWRRFVGFDPSDEPRFETSDEDLEVTRYDETEINADEDLG